MKRFGILTIVLLICFGLMAVMGGCADSDDNGNGVVEDVDPVDTTLPQSEPAYAGTNGAAYFDTEIAQQAIELPWLFGQVIEEVWGATDILGVASLAVVVDTTQTIPGGDSGTITIWTYVYESESDTLDTFRAIYEFAADGYADSVGTYNDIVAAAGTVWMEYREEEMYDGGEVAPAGTGTMIGEYFLDHVDFASFSVSTDSENQAASGYMTFTEDYDYSVGDTVHWEYTSLADVAMADYSGTTVYAGLLGASSTLAYDGSETSWVGVGTICLDSEDAEIPFDGCFDLDLNLIWAGDSNGEMPTTFPAGGTMEISASALDTTTIEAAALYDFTDTTLDPYCYWLSWDADGDGEYDDWGPEEICIP